MKNFIIIFFIISQPLFAQQKKSYVFTLDEVIEMAKSQSTEAIQAKHVFRANYWQYRSYKAEFLPSLVLNLQQFPFFTKSIKNIEQRDASGNVTITPSSEFSSIFSGGLSINQNVPYLGGVLAISSDLQRIDRYDGSLKNLASTSYISNPIFISYTQSIFGLNKLKWDKKIEPLKYEEAKRRYLTSMEAVSITAIRHFFNLANAQQNLAIAEFNFTNNEELFKIAGGRYGIGTIGENDLLQSELNYMNSRASLNDAKLQLATAKNRLRSFLGFNELADIEIVIPKETPSIDIDFDNIMQLAKDNNPDLILYRRQLIEAEKNVASEKASQGFSADLSLKFGLNQTAADFPGAYTSPKDMETVQLGVRIPILDWGRGKGRVRMAKSNQDLVKTQIEQKLADFEQDILLQVNQFNQQGEQLTITAKADTIAQNRYTVSKQRYLIDKISITEMNNAQNDKDNARQRYINALSNYWTYFYTLRQTTLQNLLLRKPLQVDYELLID